MMRKIQEPFTLPKYDRLQNEMNELVIAIKLHHVVKPTSTTSAFEIGKAQALHKEPTWQDVVDLLQKSIQELNQDRYNPVKY